DSTKPSFIPFDNPSDSSSKVLEPSNDFDSLKNTIEMGKPETVASKEPTTNDFSFDSGSSDFYHPKETSNTDFFFGNTSNAFRDIENEKAAAIPMTSDVSNESTKEESKEEAIDFIARLKNQENKEIPAQDSDSGETGTGISFGSIYHEPAEKKDFLWEPIKKTPIAEIKVPERKLEYDSNYMDQSPKENQFIINGDPNVEVESRPSKNESARIPDFMSGTIHTPDLNIETGINQELEAELLKQREEEEARRRLENSEYSAYRDFASEKVRKEMVYKAGGKSYVREVVDKPKITLEPKNKPPVTEIPEVKEEPIEKQPEEETPKKEPQSIQELIESIVDVPGLSNIEVKLNPFENPGIKFGFQEKVDKK
ncbi:MAG: hypothetical protein K2I72_01800, partial [Bacilli bacterium]|nr:hypothetical protein [Bacilli bacterium]